MVNKNNIHATQKIKICAYKQCKQKHVNAMVTHKHIIQTISNLSIKKKLPNCTLAKLGLEKIDLVSVQKSTT